MNTQNIWNMCKGFCCLRQLLILLWVRASSVCNLSRNLLRITSGTLQLLPFWTLEMLKIWCFSEKKCTMKRFLLQHTATLLPFYFNLQMQMSCLWHCSWIQPFPKAVAWNSFMQHKNNSCGLRAREHLPAARAVPGLLLHIIINKVNAEDKNSLECLPRLKMKKRVEMLFLLGKLSVLKPVVYKHTHPDKACTWMDTQCTPG